jgi:cytochrome P450
MTDKNAEWLNNRVLTLKGLKSRTEQQNILIELFDKQNRTPQDDKKFNALVRAEKAAERANKAKQAASNLIQAEKHAEKKAVRKARDHELFNAAGLLIMAGLVDTETGKPTIDKAELLGALIGLSNVPADHEKRIEWKKVGAARIAEEK